MKKKICPTCLRVLDHLKEGDKLGECCVSYLESIAKKER